MATPSPQLVALIVNNVVNAPEEHVKEIIEALKALPQMQVGTAKMKTNKGVNKSRKQVSSKEDGKGPKRPLNSWMAFRKFYNQMLNPRTQKVKSKILTILWKEELFGAKWSILAKAYSILRGNRDKEEVSLDIYLSHSAPLIGIIPPDIYLGVMGWQLGDPNSQDEAESSTLTRSAVPDIDSFPAALKSTTLSVQDIVDSCIEARLFGAAINQGASVIQTGSLSMAVQPRTSSEAASNLPLSAELLRTATAEINNQTYNTEAFTFDPTGNVNNSWNPTTYDKRHEDDGIWDGFNVEDDMLTGVLANSDVDFASFVDLEHIA